MIRVTVLIFYRLPELSKLDTPVKALHLHIWPIMQLYLHLHTGTARNTHIAHHAPEHGRRHRGGRGERVPRYCKIAGYSTPLS